MVRFFAVTGTVLALVIFVCRLWIGWTGYSDIASGIYWSGFFAILMLPWLVAPVMILGHHPRPRTVTKAFVIGVFVSAALGGRIIDIPDGGGALSYWQVFPIAVIISSFLSFICLAFGVILRSIGLRIGKDQIVEVDEQGAKE